jgi:hypothetical protein
MLPAALAAQRMVEELLGWAALVPPFATHLTGAQGGGRRPVSSWNRCQTVAGAWRAGQHAMVAAGKALPS